MKKSLDQQVVVLTGASSGIGRETAKLFASRGARLVLAARNSEALDAVVAECERAGSTAIAVQTDVSSYDEMTGLAQAAVDKFGRIDIWVNNASVSLYGTVEELDIAEIHRVIDVNLLGTIHGIKAALPHLRRAGSGTLINVSSTLGKRAVALQAPYAAAKHGVVAFAEALRLELKHAGADINVVDVLPGSINTPFFEHARSRMGVLPMPLPPVYEPAVVAQAIVGAAERPIRDVFVGFGGRAIAIGQRISPAMLDRAMLRRGRIFRLQQADAPDNGIDNLFTASEGPGRSSGMFGDMAHRTSAYTRVIGLHPNRGRALVLAGVAGVAAAIRRTGQHSDADNSDTQRANVISADRQPADAGSQPQEPAAQDAPRTAERTIDLDAPRSDTGARTL